MELGQPLNPRFPFLTTHKTLNEALKTFRGFVLFILLTDGFIDLLGGGFFFSGVITLFSRFVGEFIDRLFRFVGDLWFELEVGTTSYEVKEVLYLGGFHSQRTSSFIDDALFDVFREFTTGSFRDFDVRLELFQLSL